MMKGSVTVDILAAAGLPSPLLCTLTPEGGESIQKAVPFDSPVVFEEGDRLKLKLESSGKVIGEAELALGGIDLPIVGWVELGEGGKPGKIEASEPSAPCRIQIAIASLSLDSSSLLSTSILMLEEDADRSQLRATLEHLRGKLERDRTRHWTKVQELKTQLVERQSSYERDLWKLHSEKSSSERSLKSELVTTSLSLETAKTSLAKHSAIIADLKAQLENLGMTLQSTEEQKKLIEINLKTVKTAYESALIDAEKVENELISKLTTQGSEIASLQAALHTKTEENRRFRTEKVDLEEEIRRLRALSCKCIRLPDLQSLENKLKSTQDQHSSLLTQLESFNLDWKSATDRHKSVESSLFDPERTELLTVIDQLREQLKETRQSMVQSNHREEELKAKLLNVAVSERIKDDILSELEETNEVNAQLAQENLDLAARLKDIELAFGGGQKDVTEMRERVEESGKEIAALKGKCAKLDSLAGKKEAELRSAETKLFEVEEKVSELQAASAQVAEELRAAREQLADFEGKRRAEKIAFEEKESELKAAKSQAWDLQREVAALEGKFKGKSDDFEELEKRFGELSSEMEEKVKIVEKQSEDLSEKAAKIRDLEEKSAKNTNFILEKQSELESALKTIEKLQKSTSTYESALARKDSDLQASSKLSSHLQHTISDLQTSLTQTQSDLHTSKSSLSTLQTRFSGLETDLTKKEIELNTSKARISELQTVISDLELIIRTKDGDLQSAELRISELQDEKTDLELATESKEQEIEAMKGRVSGLEDSLAALEAALGKKEGDLHAGNVAMLNLRGKIADLEGQNVKKDGESQILRGKIAEMQENSEKLREELITTKKLVSELREKCENQTLTIDKSESDLRSAKLSLSDLSSKLSSQDLLISAQKSDLFSAKTVISSLQQELSEVETALKSSQSDLKSAQTHISTLKADQTDRELLLFSKDEEIKAVKKRMTELEESLGALEGHIGQKGSDLHSANMTILQLQEKIAELEGTLARKETEVLANRGKIAALQSEISEKDAINARKETDVQMAKGRIEEMRKDMERTQDHAAKLRSELHETSLRSQSHSQSSAKHIETLKSTLSSQSKEMTQLREDLAKANQAIISLQSEQKQSKRRLEEALKQMEDWKQAANSKSQAGTAAKVKLEDLQQKLAQKEADYAALNQEIETLVEQYTQEREGMEGDIGQLQEAVRMLEEENNELRQMADTLQNDKEDLDRLLSDAIAKIPQPKAEGKDQIDQLLVQYMNAHNLKNPFIRIAEGLYTFGTKKVSVTVKNGSLIIRVGGGYMFIEEFLRIYLPAETAKAIQSTGESTPTRMKLTLPPNHYAVVRSQSVDVEHKRNITLLCEMKPPSTSSDKDDFPPPDPPATDPTPRIRSSSRNKSYAELGRFSKK